MNYIRSCPASHKLDPVTALCEPCPSGQASLGWLSTSCASAGSLYKACLVENKTEMDLFHCDLANQIVPDTAALVALNEEEKLPERVVIPDPSTDDGTGDDGTGDNGTGDGTDITDPNTDTGDNGNTGDGDGDGDGKTDITDPFAPVDPEEEGPGEGDESKNKPPTDNTGGNTTPPNTQPN